MLDYWDTRPVSDDDDIDAVSRACLSYWKSGEESDWWGVEAVMEAEGLGSPQLSWRLLLALCALVDPADLERINDIGAGPLESFIRTFGEEAMDLIEPAVATHPTLLLALGAVWGWSEPFRPRIDRFLARHGQKLL